MCLYSRAPQVLSPRLFKLSIKKTDFLKVPSQPCMIKNSIIHLLNKYWLRSYSVPNTSRRGFSNGPNRQNSSCVHLAICAHRKAMHAHEKQVKRTVLDMNKCTEEVQGKAAAPESPPHWAPSAWRSWPSITAPFITVTCPSFMCYLQLPLLLQLLFCGDEDWTQVLTQDRRVLYHWTTSQLPILIQLLLTFTSLVLYPLFLTVPN